MEQISYSESIKIIKNIFHTYKDSTKSTRSVKWSGNFVYFMYDGENNLLYIGKSINLYNRMYLHFNPYTLKKETWKYDVSYIKYYEYEQEKHMDFYEEYYINKLNPKYNISINLANKCDINIKYIKENYIILNKLGNGKLKIIYKDNNLKLKNFKITIPEICDAIYKGIKISSMNEYFKKDDILEFIDDKMNHINKHLIKNYNIYLDEYCNTIKCVPIKIKEDELIGDDDKSVKFLNNFILFKNSGVDEIKISELKKTYKIPNRTFTILFPKYENTLKMYGIYKIGNFIISISTPTIHN